MRTRKGENGGPSSSWLIQKDVRKALWWAARAENFGWLATPPLCKAESCSWRFDNESQKDMKQTIKDR